MQNKKFLGKQLTRNILKKHIDESTEQIKEIFQEIRFTKKIPLLDIHNIGVGIIATLIGKWLDLKETELTQLTIAATLHDVGKMKIPLDILSTCGIYIY